MLHNIGWNLWDIDADVAHHVIDALEARAHLVDRDDKAVGKRRIKKVGKREKLDLVDCDDKAAGKWRIGKDGQETKK